MSLQPCEHEIETIRNAVLDALDSAARELFGESFGDKVLGATDAELPELFKGLDAHTARMVTRIHEA